MPADLDLAMGRPHRDSLDDVISGPASADGHATILMLRPEHILRTANFSCAPRDWPEDGPSLRMFRNARAWPGRAAERNS